MDTRQHLIEFFVGVEGIDMKAIGRLLTASAVAALAISPALLASSPQEQDPEKPRGPKLGGDGPNRPDPPEKKPQGPAGAGAPPARPEAKTDEAEAIEKAAVWLHAHGYFPERIPVASVMEGKELEAAVRRFQVALKLTETGHLDKSTRQFMSAPRCGVPDRPTGGGSGPKFSPDAYGRTWRNRPITWRLEGPAPGGALEAVARAFTTWSGGSHGKLMFVAQPEGACNILVEFKATDHSDGGICFGALDIGHGFAPPGAPLANYPFAGQVHLDKGRPWAVVTSGGDDRPAADGTYAEYDLETGFLHEIGHALGLDHTQIEHEEAVMWPWYHGVRRALSGDDIAGINHIYK